MLWYLKWQAGLHVVDYINSRRILFRLNKKNPTFSGRLANKKRTEMTALVFKYITIYLAGFSLCREQAGAFK